MIFFRSTLDKYVKYDKIGSDPPTIYKGLVRLSF